MHRHCEVANAHSGAIAAIAMMEQGIYTASHDKTLKLWKPEKDATGRFHLREALKVELQEACFSMCCIGGWIFCGLWDGSVKAFSQDGTNAQLRGHTKRVTAIIQHQGILITGSADRDVRLWTMDPGTKAFTCTHTLNDSMPGAISCLYVLGENLWIGGMSGIAMCNLASLKVTKLLPPVKSVARFLEFQGHVIAAYVDGTIRVFDGDGNQKSELQALAAGPIVSIGGLEAGPRFLCGHSHGQVSNIVLPDFVFKTQFQAFQNTSVESLFCAGHDGIFLFGSKSGSLQLWQKIG
jgi:WD40 repeat protein